MKPILVLKLKIVTEQPPASLLLIPAANTSAVSNPIDAEQEAKAETEHGWMLDLSKPIKAACLTYTLDGNLLIYTLLLPT
jgi:hypothetical protein